MVDLEIPCEISTLYNYENGNTRVPIHTPKYVLQRENDLISEWFEYNLDASLS